MGKVAPFNARKKSPRICIKNVDDPINVGKLKKYLAKSIANDQKRMWKKFKSPMETDRVKSPPPVSKTGLMVAFAPAKKLPIKTGLDRVKSPRPLPEKLKHRITSPRIKSARTNRSSLENREEFKVFAKNVYETKENIIKERNKKSMAELSNSRAVSRKNMPPAGVPSRKKFEGLKLLKPQPSPRQRVVKPERTRSANTARSPVKKRVSKKMKKSSNDVQ